MLNSELVFLLLYLHPISIPHIDCLQTYRTDVVVNYTDGAVHNSDVVDYCTVVSVKSRMIERDNYPISHHESVPNAIKSWDFR